MRGITCARRLSALKRAKSMTMGGECLVCRMGVVLADLVVPRCLAMKLRRVSLMRCGRCVVRCD
jgi:hypothetical protein